MEQQFSMNMKSSCSRRAVPCQQGSLKCSLASKGMEQQKSMSSTKRHRGLVSKAPPRQQGSQKCSLASKGMGQQNKYCMTSKVVPRQLSSMKCSLASKEMGQQKSAQLWS
jgi:hypothetical protein